MPIYISVNEYGDGFWILFCCKPCGMISKFERCAILLPFNLCMKTMSKDPKTLSLGNEEKI